jgi:hypothetical protein
VTRDHTILLHSCFVLYPPICFGLGIKSYMFTFIKLWDVYHGTNVGACLYSIFWMSIVVKWCETHFRLVNVYNMV